MCTDQRAFAPGQSVRVDGWGLSGLPLTIESHVVGPYYKLRAVAGVLPGNYRFDLIRPA